jgi:3-hydroxybutyryl-CoA dehydrogenase
MLSRAAEKGSMTTADAEAATARIKVAQSLAEFKACHMVVEAIVENLDAKRALFGDLEGIVTPECILATNTSSMSVTTIAAKLKTPQRFAGFHFFNPVPLMKLVEVVSGLQTDPAVAAAIFDLSQVWGKVPVHARSTPGFIVNRIARPYYAETLALLLEQAATPGVLDACLRAAGFRMGPCELMDLIGHDTNLAVSQSVYEANFFDKRFVPSLVQREMVDGGLLGRKSGRGFYDYAHGHAAPELDTVNRLILPSAKLLRVHGRGAVADGFAAALERSNLAFLRVIGSDWLGLEVDGSQLRLTDGRSASELGSEVAVFDHVRTVGQDAVLAWAPASRASAAWTSAAARWLAVLGFRPQRVSDTPGLVVARTLAMLINEAADAVLQGVCTPEGADAAMKLGVNYPAGPFEWLAQWNAPAVIALLDALDAHYRGERYRVSPWLRRFV